jgi:hypothetical protein
MAKHLACLLKDDSVHRLSGQAHPQGPNHPIDTSHPPAFQPGAECVQNHCRTLGHLLHSICRNPSRYARDVWGEEEIAWPLNDVLTLNEASNWFPTFLAFTLQYEVPSRNFALEIDDGRFTRAVTAPNIAQEHSLLILWDLLP